MFKFILLFGVLSSMNVFADACTQPEAQFFGKVTGLQYNYDDYSQTGNCSFKLSINSEDYKESGVCPLSISEATSFEFNYDLHAMECPVKAEGQLISGYLSKKDGALIIE
jgi:hypothetical protein